MGLQCFAVLTFSPQAVGSRTATLTISGDGAVPQQLTLTGTGARIGVNVSNTTLSYGDVVVGEAKSASTTFTNTGDITLDNLGVVFDSSDPSLGQFQFTTDCGQTNGAWTLAPGRSCTFTLFLAPTFRGAISNAFVFGAMPGSSSASVVLAPARQRVTYTANGIDAFNLTVTSVGFNNVTTGQTSPEKTITLTGVSSFSFSLNGTLSGTNASDFSYSNDCPATITTGTACTVHLKFKPGSTGTKTATLGLSPQRTATQTIFPYGYVTLLPRYVTLTGTSTDFTISDDSGAAPAATVTTGQPAAYPLAISQSGASQTITMSCSNLPQYASCAFTPSSFTLGSTPANVTLSIITQQTVTASATPVNRLRETLTLALLCGCGLWAAARRSGFKNLLRIGLLLLSVGSVFTAGCAGAGGGSSSTGSSGGSGSSGGTGSSGGSTTVKSTPAGVYSINVIATGSVTTRSQVVTLTIK